MDAARPEIKGKLRFHLRAIVAYSQPVRIIRPSDSDFEQKIACLNRHYQPDDATRETVTGIISAVKEKGDAALLEFTAKFGGPRLPSASALRVTEKEVADARGSLHANTAQALELSRANVRQFAERGLRQSWTMKNAQGVEVGERFEPFQRVGIYVPGGSAPLVSTAIMTVTLARAAGVPEIVVTTPADATGAINGALLAALDLSGATEIYKLGGAQAIAALAYGSPTIAPVAKVFGPGNSYVVEAKRQVFGQVAVDLLPGPSEIFIIADASANPAWIAADLLAQAEHGGDSVIVVVSDSAAVLAAINEAVTAQSRERNRVEQITRVAENGLLIEVADLEAATVLANQFAPEHLAIATRDPDTVAANIHTSGAIFLGGWSPVAGGDFVAGPSHELPTGGAGKSFAGLTVDQFQRRTSIVRFDEASLRLSTPVIEEFSRIEGLDAHGYSAAIRLEKE